MFLKQCYISNFGAGQYKRLNKVVICGVLSCMVTGLVLGNLEVLFGRQLLYIYTDSAEGFAVQLTSSSKGRYLSLIISILHL